MSFTLPVYQPPDFAALGLGDAPDVKLVPAERDGVVPEQYHATQSMRLSSANTHRPFRRKYSGNMVVA